MYVSFAILSVAIGQRIEAEYSAFSGLVAPFGLGSDENRLNLSIDFGRTRSFLFTPETCPAFVSPCFDPETSSSLQRLPAAVVKDDHQGWISQTFVSEMVYSRDMFLSDISFELMFGSSPQTPENREVAGSVSFARSSDLIQGGGIVSLIASPGGVVVEMHEDIPTMDKYVQVPILGETQWAFEGRLLFFGVDLGDMQFEFKPEVRAMRLPRSLKAVLLIAASGIAATGDSLSVPCSAVDRTTIAFSGEGEIEISHVQMMEEENGDSCFMLVEFHDLHFVIIGSQLTDSVNQTVLDPKRGRFLFDSHRSEPVKPVAARALVPVFGGILWSQNPDKGTAIVELSLGSGIDGWLLGDAQQDHSGTSYSLIRSVPVERPPMSGRLGERYVLTVPPSITAEGSLLFELAADPSGQEIWLTHGTHASELKLVHTNVSV